MGTRFKCTRCPRWWFNCSPFLISPLNIGFLDICGHFGGIQSASSPAESVLERQYCCCICSSPWAGGPFGRLTSATVELVLLFACPTSTTVSAPSPRPSCVSNNCCIVVISMFHTYYSLVTLAITIRLPSNEWWAVVLSTCLLSTAVSSWSLSVAFTTVVERICCYKNKNIAWARICVERTILGIQWFSVLDHSPASVASQVQDIMGLVTHLWQDWNSLNYDNCSLYVYSMWNSKSVTRTFCMITWFSQYITAVFAYLSSV